MKTTEQIINYIKSNKNYKPEEHRCNDDISNYLISELADVNRKAMFSQIDMDARNGNKYINGERAIKCDVLLKIFIYLEYSLEQINDVFKNYGYPQLYAKNKRDAAIIYCIYNKYSYLETKRYLQTHKIELL